MLLLPSMTTSTLRVAGVVAGEGREGGPGRVWPPPTLSLESDGEAHSSTASWSGVPEAAVARASHFCRPSFFFFLKKQQHLGEGERARLWAPHGRMTFVQDVSCSMQ